MPNKQEMLSRIYEEMARKIKYSDYEEAMYTAVLLSDVLNYIDTMWLGMYNFKNSIDKWDLSKPTIDEQSPDTIEYISSLIPNQP